MVSVDGDESLAEQDVRPEADRVWALLSEPRMSPYLSVCDGGKVDALRLYAWSSRTASAAFEVVGHLEVLLRNALDRTMAEIYRETSVGIPWFLLPTPGGSVVAEQVAAVRERLRPRGQENRHQIVAGLSFGFWSGLLGAKYETLWRDGLHRAFPHGDGRRKQIAVAVERVRKFRNRLAHHDSMVQVDVPFELRQIIVLAGYIDPAAADWLSSVSRAMDIYAERPIRPADTVVVPARDAWPLYEQVHAYVCQVGRNFRPVDRIAFYADQEVKADVPRILHRQDDVEFSDLEISRLRAGGRNERRIAEVVVAARDAQWTGGRYQVFLLSRPGDPSHRQLGAAVPHETNGRGSAFVQRQRYVSLHGLETATTTADLDTAGRT